MAYEFKQNFLMSADKPESEAEYGGALCDVSGSQSEMLDELAQMIGSGETLDRARRNNRAEESLSRLSDVNFDLEAELERVLNPDRKRMNFGQQPVEIEGPVKPHSDEIGSPPLEPIVHREQVEEAGSLPEFKFEFAEESTNAAPVPPSAPEADQKGQANDGDAFTRELERLLKGAETKPTESQPRQSDLVDQFGLPVLPISAATIAAMPANTEPSSDSAPVVAADLHSVDPAEEFEALFAEEQARQETATPNPDHIQYADSHMGKSLDPAIDPIDELGLQRELDSAFEAELGMLEIPNSDPAIDPVFVAPVTEPAVRQRGGSRKAAFAVLALALLAGLGALGWAMMSDPAEAPFVSANRDALREKPVNSGGEIVPNQDQAVYRTVDGTGSDRTGQARLKNATEEPISIAGRTKGQTRVNGNRNADETLAIRARPVRTVVVRPDGTIVASGPDAAIKDTNSSETESPNPTNVNDTAVSAANSDPNSDTDVSLADRFGSSETTVPADENATPVQEDDGLVAKIPSDLKRIATPRLRPGSETAQQPEPKVEIAAVEPEQPVVAPTKTAEAALPQVNSPYAVQISSRRSAEAARESWRKMSRRYASVLENQQVDIRQTEITGKGIYYRVRVAANTKADAQDICQRLKRAGGDCFVTR